MRSVNEKIDSLASGPGFNLCLVQHLAKNITKLNLELVNISCEFLLLEGDDAPLSEWAMRIKVSLFNMSLRLKRLQFDQASGMTLASFRSQAA